MTENLIRQAQRAGLKVERPEFGTEPRVFYFCETFKEWRATTLRIWSEDRQFTRFYTFKAELPEFHHDL